jgi:hypothetical protein
MLYASLLHWMNPAHLLAKLMKLHVHPNHAEAELTQPLHGFVACPIDAIFHRCKELDQQATLFGQEVGIFRVSRIAWL